MTSSSVITIGVPCFSAISQNFERKEIDFERPRLSLCSSISTRSLRSVFKREDSAKPWRLSTRTKERVVLRCQASSSSEEKLHELHELIIVGAGISGLATAAAMHKIGVKSLVLEQSSALRFTGSALTIWRNAWHVLDVLGVGDQLRSMHAPITGVRLLNLKGELLTGFEFHECPGGPHELRGIERKMLVEALASVLPHGTIRFNARVVSIRRESDAGPFELTLSNGSVIRTRVLLGADGVTSVVGKWMGLSQTRYAGYMGIRGLAEYPDGHSFSHSLSQYCGTGARAGVVPISHTRVYWFLVYNKANPGPKITDPEVVKEELLGELRGWPEVMYDMLERTPIESFSRAAIADRWNLPGRAAVVQNCVTVAGDAFHPMTPNLGQGGCCALEDSIVLARTLGAILLAQGGSPDDEHITRALEEYAAERQKRTLAITVKSYLMGAMMMFPFPPAVYLRDKYALPKLVRPSSYVNHTLYDPGQLPFTQPVYK